MVELIIKCPDVIPLLDKFVIIKINYPLLHTNRKNYPLSNSDTGATKECGESGDRECSVQRCVPIDY